MDDDSFIIFISDLHLCDSRPNITNTFVSFLKNTAKNAQALYVLGDFFEYWPGDDAIQSGFQYQVIKALKALTDAGTKLFIMHGNRDFLLGELFLEATGAELLPDPIMLNLYNQSVLLSHGDKLCTDDIQYQAFRKKVRNKAWIQSFLNQPLSTRIATIEQLRQKSEQEKSNKPTSIMDVNQGTVENFLADQNYPRFFIHGHTHRPKKHSHNIDNQICTRWVLGDWYERGSYLRLCKDGFTELPI
jgi:UDP-2,3-diacylglucosamine hydrolase